jgi:hypothetical protein
MKINYFILLFLNIVLSCSNSPIQSNKKTNATKMLPAFNSRELQILTDSAIFMGNQKAYNKAAMIYLLNDLDVEFLYYAMIMANKYNYPEAYFHVYIILNNRRNDQKLRNLDDRTKKIALYYLLKSYEMNYGEAKYEVDDIYINKTIPKSTEFE